MKTHLFISVLLLGMSSQAAFAHSEHDKARFVAADGEDTGLCENRFRPCQTISYAATQASKGDRVLVAKGSYAVTSDDDIFHLISNIVPVQGGYSRADHYQRQSPAQHNTVLSGVPLEYADNLYQAGFHVVTDTKGVQTPAVEKAESAIALMTNNQTSATCSNGSSGGFSCSGLSMQSHLSLSALPTQSTSANDIWGHVDLNTMREYAIIGLARGVAVVDVTDPQNPEVVGSVSGRQAIWRDIKVYQFYSQAMQRWRAYAYATTDGVSDGLMVISLNDLDKDVSLVNQTYTDSQAHNIYISNVDYTLNIALPDTTPQIHITGSDLNGGAWRSYSLKNLSAPEATYTPQGTSRSDYTHDASSIYIDDARATTDCVDAMDGACTVMLDFNERSLRIWDHTDSTKTTELSEISYPNAAYTHSGWWTEDKQYVVLHDELDERDNGVNTTVHFFDISELDAPVLAATWVGPTNAIDHNGFVRGNRYYMSNYARGLVVLDISDPLAPQEAGFFDSYPPSDQTGFNGAWGVYPFLPSGNILISDIQGGLFVVKDDTLASTNAVGFSTSTINVTDDGMADITVERRGEGGLAVSYSMLDGSADNRDYTPQTGTLTWSAGDTDSKTIQVPIAANNSEEGDEQFFITLFNPQGGGITRGKGMMSVSIESTNVLPGAATFTADEQTVREPDGQISVTVSRTGGSDGVLSINFEAVDGTAVSGGDFSATTGTLTWADGDNNDKTITIGLIDDADIEEEESFSLRLSAEESGLIGEMASVQIVIEDDDANEAPQVNAGENEQVFYRAAVVLNGSASDPENQSLTTQWTQTAGPDVNIRTADSLTASFVAPNETATLTFTLTATDDFGKSSSDDVTITVVAPPAEDNNNVNTSNGSGGGSTGITMIILGMALALQRRKRQTV